MPIVIPEDTESSVSYCPIQRLFSDMLQMSLKDAIKGDREILAWIYDDGIPNHRYRVPFGKFCQFLKLDHDILIHGLETRKKDILKARRYSQTRSDKVHNV